MHEAPLGRRDRILDALAGVSSSAAADLLAPAIVQAHAAELDRLAGPALRAGGPAGVAIVARLGGLAGASMGADERAAASASAVRAVIGDVRFPGWAAQAVARGVHDDSAAAIATELAGRADRSAAVTLGQLVADRTSVSAVAARSLLDWVEGAGAVHTGDAVVIDALSRVWAQTHDGTVLVALAIAAGRDVPANGQLNATGDEGAVGGTGAPLDRGLDRTTERASAWMGGEKPAGNRAGAALSSVLERTPDGPLRERLMPHLLGWLAHPRLARTVHRSLASINDPGARAAVLAAGHRLALPAIAAGARHIDRAARCMPPTPHLAALDARAASGLVRLAHELPLTDVRRAEAFADLATHADPLVRRASVARLAEEPLRRTAEALGRAAAGRDPIAARVARRGLGIAGRVLDPRLAERGIPAVRRAARRRLAIAGEPTFPGAGAVSNAPDGRSADGRLAALVPVAASDAGTSTAWRRGLLLAALERDRAAALAAWSADIGSGERDVTGPAIALARRFGLVAPLSAELIAVAASADERSAAAAIAALGTLRPAVRGDAVSAALRQALNHTSARVRASAIEAMAVDDLEAKPAAMASIARATGSEDPRERANAIVAICPYDGERGRALLGCMLRDQRPRHRVSAVWATRRLAAHGCEPAAMRAALTTVAERDPNALVRGRAARGAKASMPLGARCAATLASVAAFPMLPPGAANGADSGGLLGPTLGGWLMVGLLVAVVVWMAYRRWDAWRNPGRAMDGAVLRRAGVGLLDRRAVFELARAAGVAHATPLLISRGAFDQAMRSAGVALSTRAARRLARIAPPAMDVATDANGRRRAGGRSPAATSVFGSISGAGVGVGAGVGAGSAAADDRPHPARGTGGHGATPELEPVVDPKIWADAHRRAAASRGSG
ncbi:MAG: hypothetical protein AB8G96_05155 [Phycisphaerales bacterium]